MNTEAGNEDAEWNRDWERVLAARPKFLRFLVRRVGSAADADDLLQQAYVRALRQRELRHADRAEAWFYRVLRRAVADYFRARSSAERKHLRWAAERPWDLQAPDEGRDGASPCGCLPCALATLPSREHGLVRRVELDGVPRRAVAAELGVSRNALDVALHRARRALRRRLERLCGGCCDSGGHRACECLPAAPKTV